MALAVQVTDGEQAIESGQVFLTVILDADRRLLVTEIDPGSFLSERLRFAGPGLHTAEVEALRLRQPAPAARKLSDNLEKMTQQLLEIEARIAELQARPGNHGEAIAALRDALSQKRDALARLKVNLGTVVAERHEFVVFPVPFVRSGSGQSAPPGTVLQQPLVVGMTDVNRASPLLRQGVTFRWTAQAGTLDAPETTTDARGETSNRYRVPFFPGPTRIVATVFMGSSAGPSVEFEAVAISALTLRILGDPSRTLSVQTGLAGRSDRLLPLLVEAVRSGAPAPDVPIRVDVVQGTGRIVLLGEIGLRTDAEGLSGVLFIPDAGVNLVRFQAPGSGASPVDFRVTGVLPELEVLTEPVPGMEGFGWFQGSALPRLFEIRVTDPAHSNAPLEDEVVSFEILDGEDEVLFDPTAPFAEIRHDLDGEKMTCHPSRGITDADGVARASVALPREALLGTFRVRGTLHGFAGPDGSPPTAELEFYVLDDELFYAPPEDIISGQAQVGAILHRTAEDGTPETEELPLAEEFVVQVPEPQASQEGEEPANPVVVFVAVGGGGRLEAVSREVLLTDVQKVQLRLQFGAPEDASVIAVEADFDPNPGFEEYLWTSARYVPATNDGPSLVAASLVPQGSIFRPPGTVYFAVGSPEIRMVSPDEEGHHVERPGPMANMERSFVRLSDALPMGARQVEVIAPGAAAKSIGGFDDLVTGLAVRSQALDDCLDPMPDDGLAPETTREDLAVRRVGVEGSAEYDQFLSGPLLGVSTAAEKQVTTGDPFAAPRHIRLGRETKVTVPVFGNPPLLSLEAMLAVESLRVTGGERGHNWFIGSSTALEFGWRLGKRDSLKAAHAEFETARKVLILAGIVRRLADTTDESNDILVRYIDWMTDGKAEKEHDTWGDRQVVSLIYGATLPDLPPREWNASLAEGYSGNIIHAADDHLFPTREELTKPYLADPAGRGLAQEEVVVVAPLLTESDLAGVLDVRPVARTFYLPPGLYSAFVAAILLDPTDRVLGGFYDDEQFSVGQTIFLDFTPDFMRDMTAAGLGEAAWSIRVEATYGVKQALSEIGAAIEVVSPDVPAPDPSAARKLRWTVVPIGSPLSEELDRGDDYGDANLDPFNLQWAVPSPDGGWTSEVKGVFTRQFLEGDLAGTRNQLLGEDALDERIRAGAPYSLTDAEATLAYQFIAGMRVQQKNLTDMLQPYQGSERKRLELAVRSILGFSRWTGEVAAHEAVHALGLVAINEKLISDATGGTEGTGGLADHLPAGTAGPLVGDGLGHSEEGGTDLMLVGSDGRLSAIVSDLVGSTDDITGAISGKRTNVLREMDKEYLRIILPVIR